MQDIHSIGGSRIFGGGGGGGDRRLRPHHHQHQQNHQALKCPRCDSLNTKFCYYNNYNLSQPRHFCKSCRRYWTKGGVLRNVPVGGGCRKPKRSKSSKPSLDTATSTAIATTTSTTTTTPPQHQQNRDQKKANSHSSSESSSLTAANSTVAATNTASSSIATAEAASAPPNLLNITDSKLFAPGNPNLGFETGLLEQGSDCAIFSEIGSFTSLITSSSSNETLSFGFSSVLNQQSLQHQPQQRQQQWHEPPQKMVSLGGGEEMTGGLLDQTLHGDLSGLQSRSTSAGFGPLDWQGGGEQGLFDLPNAIDHTYWSQTQWTDQDPPSLYLP